MHCDSHKINIPFLYSTNMNQVPIVFKICSTHWRFYGKHKQRFLPCALCSAVQRSAKKIAGVRKASLHLSDRGGLHFSLLKMGGSSDQFPWGLSSGLVSVLEAHFYPSLQRWRTHMTNMTRELQFDLIKAIIC